MAGTVETLRVAGVPAGYPLQIDGSSFLTADDVNPVKIRYVAPLLVNMSERSVKLLKYFGGIEQFTYNNTKIEWVEDDTWNRRPSLSGTPVASAGTALTLTGQAHRYPVGTIFLNVTKGEYCRVTAVVDANVLTVTRDLTTVSTAAWASTDEVIVSGFSMQEDDNWTYRPTSIFNLPYNLGQVQSVGVQASYRRTETALYGLQGSDLDYQAANTVAEQFVAIEDALVHGTRSAGSSTIPSMAGGIKYYVTSANNSVVTDLNGATLTRKDIDDVLQSLFYAVGEEKMARMILTSAWGQRKITSFFTGAERIQTGANVGGVSINKVITDFGAVDIMVHTAIGKDEMWFLNPDNHKLGVHGSLGRPHLIQIAAPSATGPRIQRAFYADWSMIHAGNRGEGKIQEFSTSS